MSNEQSAKILSITPIESAIIKGSVESKEKNSKGASVNWMRLTKEQKERSDLLSTSKNFVEYAAQRPMVHVGHVVEWLRDNQSLENVKEWLQGLFDAVNRPLIQEAGAAGLSAKLIGDIESLIAFETLESRRGRAASRLNQDQWKIISPLLSACFYRFFTERKNIPDGPAKSLTNKYLHIANGVLVAFKAVGDDAHGKLDEMLEYAFEALLESHPDLESLLSFMIAVSLNNKQAYAVPEGDEYGY